MSAKKGRRAKMPAVPPEQKEKDPEFGNLDASNLSSIERASFLEQVQQNYGNPLHSTAMEEDLNPPEDGKIYKGGRGVTEGAPHKGRTAAAKQRGASVERKKKGSDGENKVRKERTNIGGMGKARSGKEGGKKRKKEAIEEMQESDVEEEEEESDQGPAPKKSNQPVAPSRGATTNGIKRPAKKRRSLGQKSAERPVKNGGMKMEKRRKKSGSREPSDLQSQESDSDAAQQHRRPVLSSEEATDEDLDRTPRQKRARARARKSSSDRAANRKSSSASGSPEPEETIRERRRKEGRGQQGETELEVVLDAFLDFCDQYRESVESKAVKRAIDSLSSSVKDQLTKQITESKELKVLIRDKAKVDSLIRKKRQRLLDAKYELIRAEQQVRSLQKVEVGLEQRLTDLRRSQAFLRDIRDLNRQYLKHRHTHPKEKEKYGASSLPALLLETKYILGAEHQLKGINNQIEKRLKEAGK